MTRKLKSSFQTVRLALVNLGVLGCLLGALYWGHSTHWSFGSHSQPADDAVAAPPQFAYASHSSAGSSDGMPILKFDSPADVQKAGLMIDEAVERDMHEVITANGIVSYDQTRLAQLSFRVPGTVWRVEKLVGQPVRKGEVLAILDSNEVGRAKAAFLQSVVQYDLARKNLDRFKQVSSSVPERAVREAEATARESRVEWFNAKQTLIDLGLPIDAIDRESASDAELAERIHFLGLPESLVGNLDPQKTSASLLPLIAPFDGVVIGGDIVVGEVVNPSTLQFTLADVRKMWILLNVVRRDAMRLRIGQEVVFHADGMPEDVTSRINWISTQVDPKTHTVQVRVEVDNPVLEGEADEINGQRLLRANMYGTGRIRIQSNPRAVTVPRAAIQVRGNRNVVFLPLADGMSFEPRAVEAGFADGAYVEVREGLSPGERVVTVGGYMLKSELFGVAD